MTSFRTTGPRFVTRSVLPLVTVADPPGRASHAGRVARRARGHERRILRWRRLGPEIAAHDGHVYIGIAHFPGDPSCDPASGGPREIFVRASSDGGQTFGPLVAIPRLGYPSVVDCVIAIDEVTGAVYVSFLAWGKPDMKFADANVLVAKCLDFGVTWTTTKINGPLCTACDHPWLVAHDDNVFVMYASGRECLVRVGRLRFGSCTGKTAAIYQVSRTRAGTSETAFARVAQGSAGPPLPALRFVRVRVLGYPQDDIAIDAAGNLYRVWQGSLPTKPGRPPIVQLSSCSASTDCTRLRTGATWVAWMTRRRSDVPAAPVTRSIRGSREARRGRSA